VDTADLTVLSSTLKKSLPLGVRTTLEENPEPLGAGHDQGADIGNLRLQREWSAP
jgi:hypothetical protein